MLLLRSNKHYYFKVVFKVLHFWTVYKYFFRVLCSVDDTFFIGLKEVQRQPLLFLVQKEGQDVRL